MGGLWRKTPATFVTFFAATLAIAGIPGLSGFFSKDEILWQAFSSSQGHVGLWIVGAVAAGMTAFYMFRLTFVTFFGKSRASDEVQKHIHESPPIMTVPLAVLAFLSVVGGYVGIPHVLGGRNYFHEFLAPVLGGHPPSSGHTSLSLVKTAYAGSGGGEAASAAAMEITLMVMSVIIALIGVGIAYYLYIRRTDLPKKMAEKYRTLYRIIFNKYYVDELYDASFVEPAKKIGRFFWREFDDGVVDRSVNVIGALFLWLGRRLRRIQTGEVQGYALGILVGAVVVVVYLFK